MKKSCFLRRAHLGWLYPRFFAGTCSQPVFGPFFRKAIATAAFFVLSLFLTAAAASPLAGHAASGNTPGENLPPSLEGEAWDKPKTAPLQQEWEVVFNKPVEKDSLEEGLFVLEEKGSLFPVGLELSESGRKVRVFPREDYQPGETYYLQMSGAIRDREGGSLSSPAWLEFSIESESEDDKDKEEEENDDEPEEGEEKNGEDEMDRPPEGPVSGEFEAGDYLRTDVRALRIREKPGTGSRELVMKMRGSLLQVEDHPWNGVKEGDYHWWKVSFGPGNSGWVAGEYLKEYTFPFQEVDQDEYVSTCEDTRLTQYHVPREGEVKEAVEREGNRWTGEVIKRFDALGTKELEVEGENVSLNRAFLYSTLGVSMQGSGVSDSGHLVQYGGGGAVEYQGSSASFLDKYGDPIPEEEITSTTPYWRANEEGIHFNFFDLDERSHIQGAYSPVFPWYSVAVADEQVPPGSVVYIEELDGVELENGEVLDGLFMAGDQVASGMVDGYETHLDIFLGMGRDTVEQWRSIWEGRREESRIVYDHSIRWGEKGVRLDGPGELRVYDSEGNFTGVKDGRVYREIPFTAYDREKNQVNITCPEGVYYYHVAGAAKGEYSLLFPEVTEGNTRQFTFLPADRAPVAVSRWLSLTGDY